MFYFFTLIFIISLLITQPYENLGFLIAGTVNAIDINVKNNLNYYKELIMKSLIKTATLAALFLSIPLSVNAAIITIGDLTTNDDGSTNIITDSLNNYEWLRLDVLAGYTYDETSAVLATQDGGGWNIAGIDEAWLFMDALYTNSTNFCDHSDTSFQECGLTDDTYYNGNFGDNSHPLNFQDVATFISDNGTEEEAGLIVLDTSFTSITLDAASIAYIDDRQQLIADSSWLLWRSDSHNVPEPSTILLMSMGLLGLSFNRRKKSFNALSSCQLMK